MILSSQKIASDFFLLLQFATKFSAAYFNQAGSPA
jgi:hypothetical protein